MTSVNACSSSGPGKSLGGKLPNLPWYTGNYRNRRSVDAENTGSQSENQNEIPIDYDDNILNSLYDDYLLYYDYLHDNYYLANLDNVTLCENEIMIRDGKIPDRHYAGLYRIDSSRDEIRGRPVWKHVELDYIFCYGPDGWSIMTTSDGGLAWTLPGETPTSDPMCPEPLLATGGYGFTINHADYDSFDRHSSSYSESSESWIMNFTSSDHEFDNFSELTNDLDRALEQLRNKFRI